ncbi:MAG: YceI family protein [Verrucomicrobiota bacterium]
MKSRPALLLAASFFAFWSCAENPADTTADAEVGEAQEQVSTPAPGESAITYVLSDASTIEFLGSKAVGSHGGGFREFSGQFTVDDGQLVGDQNSFVIDMKSTWSDNDNLTKHLKNDDFFSVPDFPTSTFVLTGIEEKSPGQYSVTGNLELRGVTKSVTFPAEVEVSDSQVTMKSKFDINRFDWNIKYAGMQDNLIRPEVVITLDLIAEPKA